MTTITNLPEEVVTIILNLLESKDVYQCQFICSAWYFPAHLERLKEIKPTNEDAIKQFIEAIDHNPNPTYLKAVKHINILQPPPKIVKESKYTSSEITYNTFDEETIRKMLHCFPNLEKVEVTKSTMFVYALNDELCTEVSKCCPKFDTFEINWTVSSLHSQGAHKTRLLLTKLNLSNVYLPPNVAEYISKFPRLQIIVDQTYELSNLAKLLPAFERSNSLRKLSIKLREDDKEDFVEEYLNKKTQEEQNQLVKGFSNIKCVQLSLDDGFFLNSLNFILKYMTGLDTLGIRCRMKKKATNPGQTSFLNLALDLANTVNSCDINMSFTLVTFGAYFSLITRKIFSKPGNNSLTFRMVESSDEIHTTDMKIKLDDGKRKEITCTNTTYYWLHNTPEIFTTADNVDEFRLRFVNSDDTDVVTYEKILEKVSPLKSVILDVPATVYNSRALSGQAQLPVEQVTFLATFNGDFQPLFDICNVMFPNMKHLSLYYSSGIWHQSIYDFRIEIAKCTLEKLTVDVTPVKKIMEMRSNYKFFVIEVEFWENCKRQTYKVSFDFDTVARVYDGDLDSYKRGKDYIRIHIIVTGLQYLELCVHRNSNGDGSVFMAAVSESNKFQIQAVK